MQVCSLKCKSAVSQHRRGVLINSLISINQTIEHRAKKSSGVNCHVYPFSVTHTQSKLTLQSRSTLSVASFFTFRYMTCQKHWNGCLHYIWKEWTQCVLQPKLSHRSSWLHLLASLWTNQMPSFSTSSQRPWHQTQEISLTQTPFKTFTVHWNVMFWAQQTSKGNYIYILGMYVSFWCIFC